MSKWNDPLGNFYSHIEKSEAGGCWMWSACKDKDGYGVSRIDKKKVAAHRVSWLLFKGEIPSGQYVLHKCNITSCVNPEHLYLGDQKQNVKDQLDLGTFVWGEKNGKALLTEAIVKDIRASTKAVNDLAKEYKVSYSTVWDVQNFRSWNHVK